MQGSLYCTNQNIQHTTWSNITLPFWTLTLLMRIRKLTKQSTFLLKHYLSFLQMILILQLLSLLAVVFGFVRLSHHFPFSKFLDLTFCRRSCWRSTLNRTRFLKICRFDLIWSCKPVAWLFEFEFKLTSVFVKNWVSWAVRANVKECLWRVLMEDVETELALKRFLLSWFWGLRFFSTCGLIRKRNPQWKKIIAIVS